MPTYDFIAQAYDSSQKSGLVILGVVKRDKINVAAKEVGFILVERFIRKIFIGIHQLNSDTLIDFSSLDTNHY
ncbi:hypothetical protein O9929_19645 [Vibrio lentus]|nr:hypothetical protein [Vibrio lentus]